MSEEIKMGDVFGVVCAESHSLIDPTDRWKWADFRSKKSAECAAYAINNHDRLTEENRRLRDLLRKINEGNCAYIENGKMYEEIENLLSELGGE